LRKLYLKCGKGTPHTGISSQISSLTRQGDRRGVPERSRCGLQKAYGAANTGKSPNFNSYIDGEGERGAGNYSE